MTSFDGSRRIGEVFVGGWKFEGRQRDEEFGLGVRDFEDDHGGAGVWGLALDFFGQGFV